MKRFRYGVSTAMVALGLALAPARWQQDTAAGGLAGATLAALVVALVVLAASIWQVPDRPLLAATPLTAATLLLGSAWLLDGVSMGQGMT